MKKNPESGQYQGWEYVSPPKDPAESLRRNKADLIDAKDTAAHMTKPAGTAGTSGATVGQSGVSKQIDSQEGHEYLTGMAKALAKAERAIAEFAAIALRLGPLKPAEREQIKVVYPSRFSLYSAAELTDTITKLQLVVGAAGQCPEVEAMAIRAIVRQMLPGLTDLEYRALDDEIDRVLAAKASIATRQMEMLDAGISDDSQATGGVGSAEADAGSDPTGQSGATGVSGSTTTGNAD
jgi:hypothetical protein